MNGGAEISSNIKTQAKELGFLECAILPVGFLFEEEKNLQSWLGAEYHGEMGYMARNIEKRLDPGLLVKNAMSIVVVLQNYFTEVEQEDPFAPVISKYAYGIDYHNVIKDKLFILHQTIRTITGINCEGRVFIDSAPVLERAWARRAGMGWIGRNSNLISPKHGSFFFIGELILDTELPFDSVTQVRDHCGNCTRCVDACPTKAIMPNRVIDARRCISYQTIELKGELDKNLQENFENRVFGCDICQDVCPWNLKCKPHSELKFEPKPEFLKLTKEDFYKMEKPFFDSLFDKSAVKRTGYEGFRRNLSFLQSHEQKI